MILVLAQPDDLTAERLTAHMHRRGIRCVMPTDLVDASFYATADRDGQTSVDIYFGDDKTRVGAVINRGLPVPVGSADEPDFQTAETLAGWWSALACFRGPVINRPSRTGFQPTLDIVPMADGDPHVWLSSISMGTTIRQRVGNRDACVNVHRLRDGTYVGRLHADAEGEVRVVASDGDDLHVLTEFDADRTMYLLLAGNNAFDLSSETGHLAPAEAKQLHGLVARVRRNGANFSLIVVEWSEAGARLLHATPFPHVAQYRHLEDRVHDALLRFLDGTDVSLPDWERRDGGN